VFVTRETDYDLLLARHATREQARFYLETRGQRLADLEKRHEQFQAVLRQARASVPADWRQALVRRADLDRFLFAPEDVIVAVGQDGLIANVAKYVSGQPVLGVNPAPDLYDGVLVRVPLDKLTAALCASHHSDITIEQRTMVEAVLDTGETLVALNELFVGHRSHQSARYRIAIGDSAENHSSSGLIVASGTGATGWARSIMEATGNPILLSPQEHAVAYFVREPFPSVATATTLRAGKLDGTPLSITSHMNEGGVIFADGIEQDYLAFDWGRRVSLQPSGRMLRLVTA
jgi:NAD kinase